MKREPAHELKQYANEIGFERVGVAAAGRSPHANAYLDALAAGRFASMAYLAENLDRRLDPRKTLEGATSIIALTLPYDDRPPTNRPGHGKFARYAQSRDYHKVIVPRVRDLCNHVRDDQRYRTWYNVDSGPILERDWAEAAGVGWIGKNGLVINPDTGSWFLLAIIVTDRPYETDRPHLDHCGTCTRCIDACPTDAIVKPKTIDSNRCISYWTIEHRGPFDTDRSAPLHGWVFGCDICQEVCPYNTRSRRTPPPVDPELARRPLPTDLGTLAGLTRETFLEAFAGTPVNRTKDSGLRRNAKTVLEQSEEDRR